MHEARSYDWHVTIEEVLFVSDFFVALLISGLILASEASAVGYNI
jgi:hypothetical protein